MKLTRKQKAFADHLINNPKASATQAVAETYNTIKRHTAEQIAYENLRKPEIVSYLSAHSNDMETVLINTVHDYKESNKVNERTLAVDTAKWVHDKIHGKATQRTETTSTSVNLNLTLADVVNDESHPPL